MKKTKLMLGDNVQLLKKLPENSIDSVVSDPPYGLSFMNKKWDYDVPSVEFWREVWRVLKPGGHILSFGGTRTYHRMVVNIEDAGFEIRDQIMWLYGSGFPKSHNIGKAVDKIEGNEREVVEVRIPGQPGLSSGSSIHNNSGYNLGSQEPVEITKGSSPYEGWGTALKPANEPICLARKPLSEKSVAENVLKWGTGGLNIDGCRIEGAYGSGQNEIIEGKKAGQYGNYDQRAEGSIAESPIGYKNKIMVSNPEGRFPANLILECICDEIIKGEKGEKTTTQTNINNKEANWFRNAGGDKEDRWSFNDKGDIHTNPECPCYILDEQSGDRKGFSGGGGNNIPFTEVKNTKSEYKLYNDKGGASRFFYVAKVAKTERNMGLDEFEEKETKGSIGLHSVGGTPTKDNGRLQKNTHPTVKPINLMTYLCRLITPEGGIVLDPYMGSGSTGIAALLEGFRFVGMEMDSDYFKIAESRIENWEKYKKLLKKND